MAHSATVLLIEDRASGTQLIQELIREGLKVQPCKPEHDKKMRLNAQTATIENGLVFLPREAHWLAEYVHELTTFPNAKYDDQADSTSQALEWLNRVGAEPMQVTSIRRELGRQMLAQGYSVEAVAGRLETTPDEVRSGIKGSQSGPYGWNNRGTATERLKERLARLNGERSCARCGKELPEWATYISDGVDRYCSQKCASGIP